jgi:hypothetical protein
MGLQSLAWDYDFRTKSGVRVRGIANASLIPERARHDILSFYNTVAKEIWIMSPDWFHEIGGTLFPPDASIFLATSDDETPVGFRILRRFPIRSHRILFSWFTNVRPRYQRMGTLDTITTFLLSQLLKESGSLPLYSFRTRNPIRWRAEARRMTRMAPDFFRGTRDPELYELAGDIAAHVYSGQRFDPATLAMPDAYEAGGFQTPYHVADEALDRAFYAHPGIVAPDGGVLAVGELNADLIQARITEAGL